MVITTTELITLMESWLWPLFRIAGMVMVAPVISMHSVPRRVRLLFGIALATVIVPVIPGIEYVDPFSVPGLVITVQQVVIGVVIGFTLRLAFMVLEVAGEVIAQQMGLSFAAVVAPQDGVQVPVISQFYTMLATLIFLSIDGHLLLIELLADSFTVLPVGMEGISRHALWQLVQWTGWLLSAAVLLALPAVAAMLIVNLAFGVMTRSAPQINIFAVGFPIMLLMGTVVMWLTLAGLDDQLLRVFDNAFSEARRILRG